MIERLRTRLTGSVLFWDLALTLLALWLSSYVRLRVELGHNLGNPHVQIPWLLYPAVVIIWLVVWLILTPQRAIFNRSLVEAFGRLIGSILLASASFAGLLYLSFRDFSRLQFSYFVLINVGLLIGFHILVRLLVQQRSRTTWQRRVLVIGDPVAGQQLAEEFGRRAWTGITVVGYANETQDPEAALAYLGDLSRLPHTIATHQIDEAIFALPPQQAERVAALSLELLKQPVMLHMLPSVLDLTFARTPVTVIGGIPLISLRESALTPGQRALKRMFDIVTSLVLIGLFSPILALIALLIKLESPGPIFFFQERIGEHGRRFRMIKFRSMYADADRRWHKVARRDETGRLIHKMSNDPRVTRVGRKLRRTSLDELPQLFNVLRGEMSLVGPRPEMPYIAAEYEPWQWQRFRVPPGMTGWWQVNGRSDRPMHLNTEDDLYYIQNYSFWLDLRILFKTLIVVWQGHGAY
ncbi:MAG: sugar transferase [Oscillochloridaceae bacterium umkhey_bin13]